MVMNWNKLPLVLALGSAIAVTSVVAYGARGGKPSAAEPQAQSVQLSAEQIAAQRTAVLAQAGRSAMSYIGAAQHGIDNADTESAEKYLETARDILEQMQGVLASAAASESGDLVPIFARVGIAQDVEVTDEIKGKLHALGPHVLKGEHDKVLDGLKATGIGASYTYVDLPLADTMAQVKLALEALKSGKVEAVREAIDAANRGLVTETVTVGMPLEEKEALPAKS
jgi:hypothetical protein